MPLLPVRPFGNPRVALTSLTFCLFLAPAVSPLSALQDPNQQSGRRVLATTSLAAKEYAEGVRDGRIVSAEEVEEARLFLTEARRTLETLPPELIDAALPYVDSMLAGVNQVTDPLRLTGLAESLATLLHEFIPGLDERIPNLRPDNNVGPSVFAAACASCHGDAGSGNGPAAVGLDPAPSDLTDGVALSDQAPLDFYRKILVGVSGTAMPPFEGQLSEADIWEAAWFASRLRYPTVTLEAGMGLLARACPECTSDTTLPSAAFLPGLLADPAEVARASDEQLVAFLNDSTSGFRDMSQAEAFALIGFLRSLPFAPDTRHESFADTRVALLRGLRLYTTGRTREASSTVMDAYVAFENVEREVALRNHQLATEIEFAFSDLRSQVGSGSPLDASARAYRSLDTLLSRAEEQIAVTSSPVGLFVQSFFLLLREGVEALLIVGALAALVVRAGAESSKRAIWWGVVAALIASVATAIAIETIFRIGVAQQEVLEGATMLLAAGVLLFVSYWLISKVEVNKWKGFLARQGDRAIRRGSLFALGGAAFLAVYREGFETVLFYKALFITAGNSGLAPTITGAVVGGVALLGIYFGISRFGLRLPIRQFFAITSAILMYMAFSFAGKGIAELQESSLISTTIVGWAPRIPWMGVYPTIQSLALQLGILGLIVAGLCWTFGLEPRIVSRSLNRPR